MENMLTALGSRLLVLLTTPIHTFRFPDGDVEHPSTADEVPVGTLIRSRGTLWRVSRLEGSSVFLDAADPLHGPAGGSGVTPTPLTDEPPKFEVVTEV
jgi:hypothetical protein